MRAVLLGCYNRLRELNGSGNVSFDCRRNNDRRAYSLGERRPQERVSLEATQCPLGGPRCGQNEPRTGRAEEPGPSLFRGLRL